MSRPFKFHIYVFITKKTIKKLYSFFIAKYFFAHKYLSLLNQISITQQKKREKSNSRGDK